MESIGKTIGEPSHPLEQSKSTTSAGDSGNLTEIAGKALDKGSAPPSDPIPLTNKNVIKGATKDDSGIGTHEKVGPMLRRRYSESDIQPLGKKLQTLENQLMKKDIHFSHLIQDPEFKTQFAKKWGPVEALKIMQWQDKLWHCVDSKPNPGGGRLLTFQLDVKCDARLAKSPTEQKRRNKAMQAKNEELEPATEAEPHALNHLRKFTKGELSKMLPLVPLHMQQNKKELEEILFVLKLAETVPNEICSLEDFKALADETKPEGIQILLQLNGYFLPIVKLGFVYEEKEAGTYFSLPDRDALMVNLEKLREEHSDVMSFSAVSSEGIAKTSDFLDAYEIYDTLVSDGEELFHDLSVHLVRILTFLFRRSTRNSPDPDEEPLNFQTEYQQLRYKATKNSLEARHKLSVFKNIKLGKIKAELNGIQDKKSDAYKNKLQEYEFLAKKILVFEETLGYLVDSAFARNELSMMHQLVNQMKSEYQVFENPTELKEVTQIVAGKIKPEEIDPKEMKKIWKEIEAEYATWRAERGATKAS